MRWLVLIVAAIAVELIVRFLTRGMEDKKKRERVLAFMWLGFGVVLILIWLLLR